MTDTIKDRILDHMSDAGYDVDVYIADIYGAAYDLHGQPDTPLRRQQQRLGARFTVINRLFEAGKQDCGRIVPGEMKRTYRLVRA